MTEEKEVVNLREYSYAEDVKSNAKGKILTDFMQFLEMVIEHETSYKTYIESFPTKVEPKTILDDEQGEVISSVDIEWTGYPNAESFFNQTPIKTVSELGALAIDMKIRVDGIHYANIQDGLATKKQDGGQL